MARRNKYDDDYGFEGRPRRRSGVLGTIVGMVCGVLVIGAGLLALNEFANPPGALKVAEAPAAVSEKTETEAKKPAAVDQNEDNDARTAGSDTEAPERTAGGLLFGRDSEGSPGGEGATSDDDPKTPDDGDLAAVDGRSDVPERPADAALTIPPISLSGPAIDVNARPFISPGDAGLLSVVLYGGGASALPDAALADLTLPLTLAVDLGRADHLDRAQKAAERGHEVLAVLPLAGAAGTDAGLSAADGSSAIEAKASETLAALTMAVGAAAPDGAHMLDNLDAMSALLKPVLAHSFLWVEPRASSRSAAARLAAESDLIFIQANIFVAPGSSGDQIYSGMEQAAAQAKARGTAIIYIEASQDALRSLVKWGLEKAGADVVFAPISAIARKRGKG